jgi:CheY-like chemotaxis protein
MGVDAFRTAHGFAATQPMGALPMQGPGRRPVSGAGAAPANDQPWGAGDAITEDEMQAFRVARGLQPAAGEASPSPSPVPKPDEVPVVPGFALSEAGDSFLGLVPAESKGARAYQDQFLALLVDDKDFDATKVERALTPLGYLVFRVSSEREAFQALATHEFDLIFVDTRSANGYGTARALLQRTRGGLVRPSIIALSRVGGALERLRAKLAGCDLFLPKPVDMDILQGFLRQKEALQAAQRLKQAGR